MSDKIALVTGGSRGIGAAICKALLDAGIFVWSLDKKDCDLRDKTARQNIIKNTVRQGRLDILINNAGSQRFAPASYITSTAWNQDISLMLTAPFDLCQQAYPLMKDGGHIINILSTSAFQGARNIISYVAAKHGLLGVTRALAIEWAPKIHVNAIAPGLTETDMTRQYITPERKALLESITPSGRFSQPEEIADAVVYLINSTNVYGQVITVDGGWMAKNG